MILDPWASTDAEQRLPTSSLEAAAQRSGRRVPFSSFEFAFVIDVGPSLAQNFSFDCFSLSAASHFIRSANSWRAANPVIDRQAQ